VEVSTTEEPTPAPEDRWLDAAAGERQLIRVDSRRTGGAYSVIESAVEPGCAVPTHVHHSADEHFLVISGRYRIAVGDRLFECTPGAHIIVPRDSPHSWRNIAATESRLLAIITPGGFEQIAYAVSTTPADKIHELAARFGFEILGPPVA
jgi:quercetin dioxygenase-like cupin family protein